MHDQRVLLEQRLERFVHDHLEPALYRATAPVSLTAWDTPGEPVPFADAMGQPYGPIEVGSRWGRPWGSTWLHVTGEVPAAWRTGDRLPVATAVELVVDLGFSGGPGFQAEGLADAPDGAIIKAVSPRNHYVPLNPEAPVDLYIEAAANPDVTQAGFDPTPYGDLATAGREPVYTLRRLDIGLRDVCVWELLQDVFTLLKLGFGFDVHADRSASETQFGHVYRATHTNTSWDQARFEICAHRWIHVAEPGYGVTVSNDSTYGHDVGRTTRPDRGTTTTVRLSLVRGSRYPDPEADQGRHTNRVTVRPGSTIADAVAEGYRTNLTVREVQGEHDVAPLVRLSNPAIVVEAVKLAEDRSVTWWSGSTSRSGATPRAS